MGTTCSVSSQVPVDPVQFQNPPQKNYDLSPNTNKREMNNKSDFQILTPWQPKKSSLSSEFENAEQIERPHIIKCAGKHAGEILALSDNDSKEWRSPPEILFDSQPSKEYIIFRSHNVIYRYERRMECNGVSYPSPEDIDGEVINFGAATENSVIAIDVSYGGTGSSKSRPVLTKTLFYPNSSKCSLYFSKRAHDNLFKWFCKVFPKRLINISGLEKNLDADSQKFIKSLMVIN
ncbi:MAG: hypothetical protein Solumvirus2_68 [Solumvirus sp.]|uniref:Uncharacterized protein n=1 Tax=Solumvirus sp. TaxID=2487773 RepID=A0A3G5AIX5_9VIRU|nr:MAG: hypothetical protein Solumvirus2_68 [Solumvirus sp.]